MQRILVIDDQAPVRAAIAAVLTAKGNEVVGAEDGAAGLLKLEESPFDVVLVDLYMPKVDGVKIIKQLRVRYPRLPVIAMSGVILRESTRMAIDMFPLVPELKGIVCLKKPFRATELLAAISQAAAVTA
ncbi:MAG TPA: response regulator [Candidatus Binataceae bacterium]|nr:response regulator [Candidatus Binataceae bacterium]